MSVVFNVGVRDSVTYYWRLTYVEKDKAWVPVSLVPIESAVNGGPTYGVPLNVIVTRYAGFVGVPALVTHSARASYYGSSSAGCPGLLFLRTIFTAYPNGQTATYRIRSNGRTIIRGIIRAGTESDRNTVGLPGGGDPGACADPNNGISGGN